MYFGSVRFFKDLIRSVAILLIAVLLTLSIVFIIKYNNERITTEKAQKAYNELSLKINIPSETDINMLYSALRDKGYTAEDIINAIKKEDPAVLDEIYKYHFEKEGQDTSDDYTKLYPELYVTPPEQFKTQSKTIYFTFDDGPSQCTPMLLSILDKYNIKATFFMSGSESEQGKAFMKMVADDGHAIGIHSFSHKYDTIYQNPQNFLDDMSKTSKLIQDATGKKPDIIRFAGGSINNYNRSTYQQIIAEVTRRGYVYYDWNVSGQDASSDANWTTIYNNVLRNVKGKDTAIILLHDSKEKTVTVLEDLIVELKKQGYSFDKLSNDVKPVTFTYVN